LTDAATEEVSGLTTELGLSAVVSEVVRRQLDLSSLTDPIETATSTVTDAFDPSSSASANGSGDGSGSGDASGSGNGSGSGDGNGNSASNSAGNGSGSNDSAGNGNSASDVGNLSLGGINLA